MKQAVITFDYEGALGMPFVADYDQLAATKRILEALRQQNAQAVFFVVGRIAETNPELVRLIAEDGHEIGLHGYNHEHLHDLDPEGLSPFMTNLDRAVRQIEDITGSRPRGFRAPYLAGPVFYVPTLYRALKDSGFTWISNREIRLPEELVRPDRLPFMRQSLSRPRVRPHLLMMLNYSLLTYERPGDGDATSWLHDGAQPFLRPEGLIEYPLNGPLDCDLVGFPQPDSNSGQGRIDYAVWANEQAMNMAGDIATLSFHDWIAGTSDRTELLSRTLEAARTAQRAITTPNQIGVIK